MSVASAPPRSSSRELAFQVVRDVFGPDLRGAQAAFDARARRSGLSERDRAFAAELAYGSIKARRLLDWYLRPYIGERTQPLPAAIAEIVRLGIYQLRCMGGVDDHAAVFETVNLALRHGHKGTAGLVNAVLRRFIADAPAAPEPSDFERFDDYLGTANSVPSWVAARFGAELGEARDAALAGINAAPQHAVCVNALRSSADEVRAALAARGAHVEQSPFASDALVVTSGSPGDDADARWTVQSEAACFPVDLLAPQPGERVLESCSGRGHKSVQIAARMRAEGTLLCIELDARKTRVLREALERAGATNAAVIQGDATSVDAGEPADAVLLDAPCSGLGVLGRHPEARWRKSPDDAARLAPLQARLLRAAAERTKPGGRLVYSVCSTDPREGAEQIAALLRESPRFTRAALPERYAAFERDGDVLVPPGIDGRDGFYIAVLTAAA